MLLGVSVLFGCTGAKGRAWAGWDATWTVHMHTDFEPPLVEASMDEFAWPLERASS